MGQALHAARRQGPSLRGNLRATALVAALLLATSFASFQAGARRQALLGVEDAAMAAASAAPPTPRCAEQLVNATAAIMPGRPHKPQQEGDLQAEFRLPGDTLAERSFLTQLDAPAHFIASPSIVVLPSGRLLVVYEKQAAWGVRAPETATKVVMASDDGGTSWQHVGSPGPMHWPSIFQCASGVYIIGVQRHFSDDNNVLVTRMLDEGGAEWSPPARVTSGLSVVMANTGVDVSWGRVTKAFEIIPVKGRPIKASNITHSAVLHINLGDERLSWHAPPRVNLTVLDSQGFPVNTLVKIDYEPHPLFFRILAVDHSRNFLQLRLERFTLFWMRSQDVIIEAGALLKVGSGAHIYGGVDWVSMAMSADEEADLTKPEAWTLTEPLGNPASTRVQDMAALFDVAFRPDYAVRRSILGFDHDYVKDTATALDAGFGSLYWMEGVAVRLQDRRGSSGQLLVTLRVNNDLFCDMAALVALDDTSLRLQQLRQQEAAAGTPADEALADVISAAATTATATGRRLLRRAFWGAHASARWQQGLGFGDSPGFNDSPEGAGRRGLQQAAAADPKQQQQKEAQEAQDAGLPLLSAPAEDVAAAEADEKKPLTDSSADALPAEPEAPRLEREFLRFKNIPGLAIGHPAILYDNVTDLYWMTSNMNRDSTRRWRQPWQKTLPKLHITPFSKCEVDRTTMGLYYSGNAVDWWPAGVLDYHLDFAAHFTYPHMAVAGDDLLVVMRATAPVVNVTATSKWYNNHNSNAVSFHRVRDFRRFANVQWATYEGEYTLRPRVMSSTS